MIPEWRRRIADWARDALVMYYAIGDKRVPRLAKIVAVLPVLYLFMPVDILPDAIPVIGWIDDVAAIPLAYGVFRRLAPLRALEELRERADMRLMRLGPRVGWFLAIFLIVWLALAGLGGWRFYHSVRASQPPGSGLAAPVESVLR